MLGRLKPTLDHSNFITFHKHDIPVARDLDYKIDISGQPVRRKKKVSDLLVGAGGQLSRSSYHYAGRTAFARLLQ